MPVDEINKHLQSEIDKLKADVFDLQNLVAQLVRKSETVAEITHSERQCGCFGQDSCGECGDFEALSHFRRLKK